MLSSILTIRLVLCFHFYLIVPLSCLHQKKLRRWPDAIVYFDIDPSLPKDYKDVIKYAVQYMNSLTCVQWTQRYPWQDDVPNYVTFNYYSDTKKNPTCQAGVGFKNGRQELKLGRHCWEQRYGKVPKQRRTVLHEMMHLLGFQHEHQRPDRDCYVKIKYGYLLRLAVQLIKVRPKNEWVDDFPYDYHSIMHYAINTGITPLNKSIVELGRHDGTLSSTDINKVESLYCGAPSFCGVQKNALTCRDIWEAKVNNNCSDWSGWISPH